VGISAIITRRSEFANLLRGYTPRAECRPCVIGIDAYERSTFSRTKLTLSLFKSRTCTEGSMKAWFKFNFVRPR
jgi:hypothetical protein